MSAGLEQIIEEIVRRVVREELAELRRELAPDGGLLTLQQAAKRIGMSESFIRDASKDGRLQRRKIGRAVRFAIADVDALAARRTSSLAADASPRERAALIAIGGRR